MLYLKIINNVFEKLYVHTVVIVQGPQKWHSNLSK